MTVKLIGSAIGSFWWLFAVCGMAGAGTVADDETAALDTAPGNTDNTEVPAPFQGYNELSKQRIDYDILSDVLGAVVLDTGHSRRVFVPPAEEITGTRLKSKVTRTANEGNRLLYEEFRQNGAGRAFLKDVQRSLEELPGETPLENFSREEQLAYWLNLYNITVINQVIEVYPKRSLRKVVDGEESIFSRKLLNVAGIPLSLDDIQFTILKTNYNSDPLIIYGLYQGIVGGPNIRKSAYYGSDVYYSLQDNAYEFINSNRGTLGHDADTFRVSSFYERNKAYFPEFESDLAQHLLQYLEGEERGKLILASTLVPNIDDWTVTDMGGTRHRVGGSLAHNNAALMDSFRSNHSSVYGGVLTATVEVRWNKDEVPTDEAAEELQEIQRAPMEGAQVEILDTSNSLTQE